MTQSSKVFPMTRTRFLLLLMQKPSKEKKALQESKYLYEEVYDMPADASQISRKRKYVPQPPLQLRTAMASHLSMIGNESDDQRCCLPGAR
ncbi:unnamed protein product [Parnassius apollo]|uniref:(apollo) hypothetical protein n=1 Tax=Parnassius apollo TaxID=110799 RepID=A0A8S3W9M0_PARAO|nr:unnamed protein product [Parnassius apollo]